MSRMRVGIFGGTFNPPHKGHVNAAEAFVTGASLDKLIIMPAFIPPHKEYESVVSCEDRLEMCKIAFKDVNKTTVSDLEISRGGKSYTYLTLEELSQDGVELFFLCGTDMILSMDTWKDPEIIFSLANICYIRRECDPKKSSFLKEKCEEYRAKFGAKVIEIESDVVEISSTEIRDGLINEDFLPADLIRYIDKKGLYR